MKKLILLTTLILLTGLAFGQNLQKGNLVGTHVLTIDLKPGVTMEQFIQFFNSKLIPAWEKHYGMKTYLVKSIRGEIKNSYGLIAVFKSEKDRDKYFNVDGGRSELGNSAEEKVKPVMDELNKLGTFTRTYTDWVIQ